MLSLGNRGRSSFGRASGSQSESSGFESRRLHKGVPERSMGGGGAAWEETSSRQGSNPCPFIFCGIFITVLSGLSKPEKRVRLPYTAFAVVAEMVDALGSGPSVR